MCKRIANLYGCVLYTIHPEVLIMRYYEKNSIPYNEDVTFTEEEIVELFPEFSNMGLIHKNIPELKSMARYVPPIDVLLDTGNIAGFGSKMTSERFKVKKGKLGQFQKISVQELYFSGDLRVEVSRVTPGQWSDKRIPIQVYLPQRDRKNKQREGKGNFTPTFPREGPITESVMIPDLSPLVSTGVTPEEIKLMNATEREAKKSFDRYSQRSLERSIERNSKRLEKSLKADAEAKKLVNNLERQAKQAAESSDTPAGPLYERLTQIIRAIFGCAIGQADDPTVVSQM
jgi:hypothetical protein